MGPGKGFEDSGRTIRLEEKKWTGQMGIQDFPVNESLLPYRATNSQVVLVLCHLPLHPDDQRLTSKISRRLTTPHELVYKEKLDAHTWFSLFYIGY